MMLKLNDGWNAYIISFVSIFILSSFYLTSTLHIFMETHVFPNTIAAIMLYAIKDNLGAGSNGWQFSSSIKWHMSVKLLCINDSNGFPTENFLWRTKRFSQCTIVKEIWEPMPSFNDSKFAIIVYSPPKSSVGLKYLHIYRRTVKYDKYNCESEL